MLPESRPLKGPGPYNIREVALALLAVGIAGIAWGLESTSIIQMVAWPALAGGFVVFVAGLGLFLWELVYPWNPT